MSNRIIPINREFGSGELGIGNCVEIITELVECRKRLLL